ncbi:transforming growth factor, beta-induced, 68kDa [Seminavis robusta]|uniref:Transforming growth factor, beta-induced, 68kDa n=1 Tax=Seminavis robusta TaxID=568900 RepID=A0A9N8H3H4_9STRA|nr:transforming growth factor, beta-induced, 68kDa [Seminavis robusta]|eukprot:Sro60_g034740.1 transforming growth factor, beta-induced, 68kDa (1949) ;mRNA; f:86955-92951
MILPSFTIVMQLLALIILQSALQVPASSDIQQTRYLQLQPQPQNSSASAYDPNATATPTDTPTDTDTPANSTRSPAPTNQVSPGTFAPTPTPTIPVPLESNSTAWPTAAVTNDTSQQLPVHANATIRQCILSLFQADSNGDNYLDAANEYIHWINQLVENDNTTDPSLPEETLSFSTLTPPLQELFITYAATYSETDHLDIHGARPGTLVTSLQQGQSLNDLCEEALILVATNRNNTSTQDGASNSNSNSNSNATDAPTSDVVRGDYPIHENITTRNETDSVLEALSSALFNEGGVPTLVSLLQLANLTETLSIASNITLFAPSDTAFNQMNPEELAFVQLPENRELLVDILTYHMLPNSILLSTDFVGGNKLTMVNGRITTLGIDPPRVNEAVVSTPDVIAANGVIHVIGNVLLPNVQSLFTVPANDSSVDAAAEAQNGTDPNAGNATVADAPSAPTNETNTSPDDSTTPTGSNSTASAQNASTPAGFNATGPNATVPAIPNATNSPNATSPAFSSNTSSALNTTAPSSSPTVAGATSPSPTVAPTDNPGPAPTTRPMNSTPANVWELLLTLENINLFLNGLEQVNVDKLLIDTTEIFTVFAPVDSVVLLNEEIQFFVDNINTWSQHLTDILEHHLVAGSSFLAAELFNGVAGDTLTSLAGEPVTVQNDTVGGQSITQSDLISANGVVHLLDGILAVDRLTQNLAQMLESGLGVATNQRRLQDGQEFARVVGLLTSTGLISGPRLTERSINGATLLAPTNGAFAQYQEEENSRDLLLYHMIPRNVYAEIDSGTKMLVSTEHPTADMWVTVDDAGMLHFNGKRAVSEVLGQNGVLHVVEELLEPPSLVDLFSLTNHNSNLNIDIMNEFLLASDSEFWESIGADGRVTLFVPVDDYLENNTRIEDRSRLVSPLWSQHLRDLLSNLILSRPFSKDELLAVASRGATVLPTIGMQNLTVEVDVGGTLAVGEGRVLYPPISATNGIVHILTSLPLPPSVTSSVMDLLPSISNNSNLVNIILDAGLDRILSSLSPVTFFAPAEDFFGIPTTELADMIENHIFEGIFYFDELLGMDGTVITSVNSKEWVVSVLDSSVFLQAERGSSVVARLETPFDLLGNNGVLHRVDALLSDIGAPLTPNPNSTNPPNATVPAPTSSPTSLNVTLPTRPNVTTPNPNSTIPPTVPAPTSSPTPVNATLPTRPNATSPAPTPAAQNATYHPSGGPTSSPTVGSPTPGPSTKPPLMPVATFSPTASNESSAAPTVSSSGTNASAAPVPTPAPTGNVTNVRVNTSFVISNTNGLTSLDVSLPENAMVLNQGYTDFVQQLVADVEKSQQRRLRGSPQDRRLSASLDAGSRPSLYGVHDMTCPTGQTPPIPDNAACQTVYGRYDLIVSDEDPIAVHAKYEDETAKAIDEGKLQSSLDAAASDSPFTVIGAAKTADDQSTEVPTADDGNKMEWWMILIIVLASVSGCCCMGVALAFFMLSSRKKDQDLEKLVVADEGLGPSPTPNGPVTVVELEDGLFDDSDAEDEDPHISEERDNDSWKEDDSTVNEIHEDPSEHTDSDSEWEESGDSDSEDGSDDGLERSPLYPLPKSVIHDDSDDDDTEKMEAQPFWDDADSSRDEWLGDDATVQVEESVAGAVDEESDYDDTWEHENEDGKKDDEEQDNIVAEADPLLRENFAEDPPIAASNGDPPTGNSGETVYSVEIPSVSPSGVEPEESVPSDNSSRSDQKEGGWEDDSDSVIDDAGESLFDPKNEAPSMSLALGDAGSDSETGPRESENVRAPMMADPLDDESAAASGIDEVGAAQPMAPLNDAGSGVLSDADECMEELLSANADRSLRNDDDNVSCVYATSDDHSCDGGDEWEDEMTDGGNDDEVTTHAEERSNHPSIGGGTASHAENGGLEGTPALTTGAASSSTTRASTVSASNYHSRFLESDSSEDEWEDEEENSKE